MAAPAATTTATHAVTVIGNDPAVYLVRAKDEDEADMVREALRRLADYDGWPRAWSADLLATQDVRPLADLFGPDFLGGEGVADAAAIAAVAADPAAKKAAGALLFVRYPEPHVRLSGTLFAAPAGYGPELVDAIDAIMPEYRLSDEGYDVVVAPARPGVFTPAKLIDEFAREFSHTAECLSAKTAPKRHEWVDCGPAAD
jgi:hypothetical protein